MTVLAVNRDPVALTWLSVGLHDRLPDLLLRR